MKMIDMKAQKYGIHGFFGPFRFLSNFHLVPVEFDGHVYPSTEHAYQAAKTNDQAIREAFALAGLTPAEVKRFSKELPTDEVWHTARKFEVMLELTRKKYAKDPLKQMLLDTGDLYLEETNHWGDTCWGVCGGVGDNHLGRIIMQVRDELRSS